MSIRTLEEAFNAVFHDKNGFNEFLSLDLNSEITKIQLKDRVVITQSIKLKKYLRFIDKVIYRHLRKDDDVVHSFIKGKSTLSAVQAHSSKQYFFLTDIQSFYSNIKRRDVKLILERDEELIPISDFKDYIDFLVGLSTYQDSVPVGFPTSPQLSNAFLFEFDNQLKKLCAKNSLIYTRYADDIIVSGESFEQLCNLRDDIQGLLNTYGSANLKLKESKTRITSIGNKVKILGLVLLPNGSVTLDSKYKNKIETLLHFYTSDKNKYNDLLNKSMNGKEKSLFGLLHYANSIDQNYMDKIQQKYGVLALRSLMEDSDDEP